MSKKKETKTRKWTKEAMEQAMQEVQGSRLTSRQAAKKFGVPRSSLTDRLSGRVAADPVHGQKQLLDAEDENSLVEYCLYSASQGFPLTKPQVVDHALAIYNYRNPDKPKTILGQTWWRNFRERHHNRLATQTIDFTDQGKESCMKKGPTEDFFRLLTAILEEKGLRENPCQIYNCAKTNLQLYSARKKVPQETRHSHRQTQKAKDHITILACFNAAGEDVPPFIIYEGENPGGHYKKEGISNALYSTSPTGDLDGELFRKWFVEHFLKFAVQERPLLLVMDKQQSQVDPELVQEAQRERVILLFLPPHTSHILQPLDVSFFGSLKADIHSFSVSRKEFSRVLRDSYQGLKDKQVVMDGFRSCGLYPLNPAAIDSSQFMVSDLQRDTPTAAPSTPLSSCAMSNAIYPSHLPLFPFVPPKNPTAAPPYSPYLSHPLVASGRIPADLAHLLIKTHQTCNIGMVRRKVQVLTAQKMSDVIKEEGYAPGMETKTLKRRVTVQQQRTEDISPAATSSALPSGPGVVPFGDPTASTSDLSNTGPSALFAPSSASRSLSVVEASKLCQTSSTPPAPLSSGSSSSSTTTTGPTASTAAKRQKREKNILRCGRCRQSYPPRDPEGLVLWVQCDNCHKLFHTICVSSEMDLDEDQFWCFWCLDD